MLLHRAAPAAARRPASSPAGRAERGRTERGGGCCRSRAHVMLTRWPSCVHCCGACPRPRPLPGALEVERRGPCRRCGGPPNPGEGGGRAAGGARPAAPWRSCRGPPAEPAPPWPPRGRARAVPRCRPGAADASSTVRWRGPSCRHGLRRRHSRAPPRTRGAAAAGDGACAACRGEGGRGRGRELTGGLGFCKGKEDLLCAAVCWRQKSKNGVQRRNQKIFEGGAKRLSQHIFIGYGEYND